MCVCACLIRIIFPIITGLTELCAVDEVTFSTYDY